MVTSGNMRKTRVPQSGGKNSSTTFKKTGLHDTLSPRSTLFKKAVKGCGLFSRFVVPVGTLALVSINFCCKKQGLEFIKPEYLPFFKGATFVSICILLDEIPSFFLPNNKSLMKTFFDNLEKKLVRKTKKTRCLD